MTEDADALMLWLVVGGFVAAIAVIVTAFISLALYNTLGFAIALGWFAGILPAYFGWFRRLVAWGSK